jgi:hypothetical protein
MQVLFNVESKKKPEPQLYTVDEMMQEDGVYRIHKQFPSVFVVVSNGCAFTNDWNPARMVDKKSVGWAGLKFYKTDDAITVTFKN